jgi:hypothetical protein
VTGRTALLLLASSLAVVSFLAGTQLVPGGAAAASPKPRANDVTPLVGFTPVGKPGKRGHRKPPGPPKPPPSNSITLTDQMWVCNGPVDLDSVTVTMTSSFPSRRGGDGVHLEAGCTGRIGTLNVTTSIADGVKVGDGAHDLTIGGGSIHCLAKLPVVHQDGIQVMGGTRITFRNLTVDCGRADERLINSNLFIRMAGRSATPPTDIVCDHCHLGPYAAHTVNIQDSVRSGVRDSTVCGAKYPRLTLTVGPEAVDPVDAGDSVGGC